MPTSPPARAGGRIAAASPAAFGGITPFAIPFAISEYTPDEHRVREMVGRLILAITRRESVAAGWRSLVEPKDIVGIKISATGGATGATHRPVVEAIVDGLREAGRSCRRTSWCGTATPLTSAPPVTWTVTIDPPWPAR